MAKKAKAVEQFVRCAKNKSLITCELKAGHSGPCKDGQTTCLGGLASDPLRSSNAIRLDLGCGPNKRPGTIGVDAIAFHGVDVVADLRKKWPWKDGTVAEVHCSHFVEHLTAMERIHFANELHRVLMPNQKVNGVNVEGFATIIVPHWASCRAYGDPTHQWPPVSEFWFWYLSKDWRDKNAPHTDAANLPGGFACDFDHTCGVSFHPQIQVRSQDAQQFAAAFYKEAVQDLIATVTKK